MTDEEIQRVFDLWWGSVGKFDESRARSNYPEDSVKRGFFAAIKLMLEKSNA